MSMNAVPKGTPIAQFSTTIISTVENKSPIFTSNVILPLVLSLSIDEDKSDGCTSLHI